MSKLNLAKITIGLAMLLVGGFLLFSNFGKSEVAQAQSGTTIKSYWVATQLLTIDTNNVLWGELGSNKRYFAIGPGEWKVTTEENGTKVYSEIWKLPEPLPDCYGDVANRCKPGSGAENYLWSLGWETGGDTTPASWTFTLKSPDDQELFRLNNNRAYGQGSIGGKDFNNIHAIVTTGAYGWMHARFDESNAGGVVTAGSMIPLKWEVTGTFE